MASPRLFSNAQERRLLREYEAGATAEILAKKSNCSDATIFNIIKRLGGKPRHRSCRKRNATDQQIIRLYRKLKNGNETARQLHVSETGVYDVIRAHGIKLFGHELLRKFDDEQARKLLQKYNAGASAASLAKKTKCSIYTIIHSIQRVGGKLREPLRLSQEQKKRAVQLYKSGLNAKGTADKLGMPHWLVLKFLKRERPEIMRADKIGPAGPHWRGGKMTHHSGYSYVWVAPDDPMASMRGASLYVLEHRLAMARKLKRLLLRSETVHHINGDRLDNRIENLEIRQGRHGRGIAMHCLDCGSRNIGHAKLEQ